MGQVLHGGARATQAVRRSIQQSRETVAALARRHGVDRETVAKWRRRRSVEDAPVGPEAPRSTVLSVEEEATVVAFRRHTLPPLDDGLYALRPAIPHLTRPSLHRRLRRHGIGRLPEVEGEEPKRRAFKERPVGYVHVDTAEVRAEEGKLYLFVAVDRTSEACYAELHGDSKRAAAAAFPRSVVGAFPYELHTVLTDDGVQFTHRARDRRAFRYLFGRACAEHGVEHRLTRVGHPWTNGQAERMDRTPKEAMVKRYHYGSHAELRDHLAAFPLA